jgi:hypothetical protein
MGRLIAIVAPMLYCCLVWLVVTKARNGEDDMKRKMGILAFVLALVAIAGFAQAPTNPPVDLAEIFSLVAADNPGVEPPRETLFAPEPLEMSGCTEEGAYRFLWMGYCCYNGTKYKEQYRCTNGQWVPTGAEGVCFNAVCP